VANPQKEDGYVPIANEILDAFARYRIPGEARQILDAVIRKTYGWQKTEDEISLTQFSILTGLSRSSVVRAIKWLVTKKLLVRYKEVTSFANKYKFNKNFDVWIRGYKKDTTRKSNPGYEKVTESGYLKVNQGVTKKKHTIDTITKDTSKDTIDTLFSEFWEAYPKRNGKKIGKDDTLRQFIKLEDPEQRQVIIAAKNYFKSSRAQNGFALDPTRFFKSREYPNGLWRDWIEPEVKDGLQTGGIERQRESAGERKSRIAREAHEQACRELGIRGKHSPMAPDVQHGPEYTDGSDGTSTMAKKLDSKIIDCTALEIPKTE